MPSTRLTGVLVSALTSHVIRSAGRAGRAERCLRHVAPTLLCLANQCAMLRRCNLFTARHIRFQIDMHHAATYNTAGRSPERTDSARSLGCGSLLCNTRVTCKRFSDFFLRSSGVRNHNEMWRHEIAMASGVIPLGFQVLGPQLDRHVYLLE